MSRGHFVWHDLMTSDQEAAIAFYQGLLGWSTEVQEMDTGPYTMAKVGDRYIGGFGPLDSGQGAPPYWVSYISVDDIDAACAQIEGLGGRILQPPFTVPTVGQMAYASDPDGAVFAPFQDENPGNQPELPVGVQPGGAVAWHEVIVSDEGRGIAFYRELFGWGLTPWEMGGYTYHGLTIGETPVAGLMKRPDNMPVSAWTIYFESPGTIEESAAAVTRLGGTILQEPFTVAGTGDILVAADPTGATFGLLKSLPMDGLERKP